MEMSPETLTRPLALVTGGDVSKAHYHIACIIHLIKLDMTPITDHHAWVSLIHINNDISITKVTHAGCCYAVQNTCAHGVTMNGTKALGGWNESGAFRNCYDWAFPVDALHGAAEFNAR